LFLVPDNVGYGIFFDELTAGWQDIYSGFSEKTACLKKNHSGVFTNSSGCLFFRFKKKKTK